MSIAPPGSYSHACTSEEFFALVNELKSNQQAREEKKILVYTDSSLSLLLKNIARDFQKKNPDYEIIIEPSPAKMAIRKVIDMGKNPDLLIFYSNNLAKSEKIVPTRTSCLIQFARDRLVIAYADSSTGGQNISSENWPDYIFDDNIRFGKVRKEMDPLGIYTESMSRLAGSLFKNKRPDFIKKWDHAFKDAETRSDPMDLSRQIESGNLDFGFLYSSLARAHRLKTLDLQKEIDFSKSSISWIMEKIGSIKIKGPKSTVTVPGELVWIIACAIKGAPHPGATTKFLKYIASGAAGQLEKAGLIPNIVEGMAE